MNHPTKINAKILTLCALLAGALPGYAQPTTLPAAPTIPAGQVIAIYNSSGAYTDISAVNDFESWGGWTGAGFYTVGNSQVLGYYGVSYGGIGFETNPQNVSGCTNLFMNVYTPNGDSFAIRVVDTSGRTADITFTSGSGIITDNTWLNLNFPLSQFTAINPALNLGSIQQIGLICNNPGEDPGSDYYLDNIFFAGSTNLAAPPAIPVPTNNAATPTQPAASVVALYNSSGVYTDVPLDDWDATWSSAIESSYTITTTGATVLKYNALQYAGVEFEGSDAINAAACNYIHADIWTPNANQFGIQLVSLDNGGTQAAQVNVAPASGTIVSNQWVGLDIPLTSFTAVNPTLDLTALQQLLWIDNQAGGGVVGGIFYIDNVYFYSNAVVPPPVIDYPTNNAPTPTRPAGSVLAMYDSSGAYPLWAGSGGVNWDASWSGTAEFPFAITNPPGSTVMYLPSLSYVGVEFYDPNQIDTTGFSALHFDVWTLNANQIGVQLVSLSPTVAAQVYVPISTTNHWVGIDIPLSQFTAEAPSVVLNNLQQLLWVDNGGSGTQGGTFYIDNVYFWTTNQVQASISQGKQVSWTANFADSYQPQKSANGSTWANVGGLLIGNAVTSVYDSSPVSYYRVLDISSTVANLVLNPSFEIPAANNCGAADWTSSANTATESVWVTNSYGSLTPHSGTNLLYLEGTTPASGPVTPPNTYAYQNLIPVSPGVSYAVSFYAANPVQIGAANPQYFVQFYDGSGNFLSQNVPNFASAGSTWTKFSSTNTAPALSAQMAVKFIQALGAGNGWDWVTLIDDVTVANASAIPVNTTNVLSAAIQPGVGITWQSDTGLTYTVQSTPSLTTQAWSPLGANVVGTGTNTVSDAATSSQSFYRVLEDY